MFSFSSHNVLSSLSLERTEAKLLGLHVLIKLPLVFVPPSQNSHSTCYHYSTLLERRAFFLTWDNSCLSPKPSDAKLNSHRERLNSTINLPNVFFSLAQHFGIKIQIISIFSSLAFSTPSSWAQWSMKVWELLCTVASEVLHCNKENGSNSQRGCIWHFMTHSMATKWCGSCKRRLCWEHGPWLLFTFNREVSHATREL